VQFSPGGLRLFLFPHSVGREAQVSRTHTIEISIRRLIAALGLLFVIGVAIFAFIAHDQWMPTVRKRTGNGVDQISGAEEKASRSESSTRSRELAALDLAAEVAQAIADGTVNHEPDRFAATPKFTTFLERIANGFEESGTKPSMTFVRFKGEPAVTIMTDEFADVSVHIVYRDRDLYPSVLHLSEIVVHLVHDDGWKVDSIRTHPKGVVLWAAVRKLLGRNGSFRAVVPMFIGVVAVWWSF
jgi:hypothetical protein